MVIYLDDVAFIAEKGDDCVRLEVIWGDIDCGCNSDAVAPW